LSFIEFWCHSRTVARYRGTDVFSVTAEELFKIVAAHESGGPHAYDPLEYVFPEQIIAVWSADSQYDCRTRQTRVVWGTVAVGDARYLQAVRQGSDPDELVRLIESYGVVVKDGGQKGGS
jgi:hypothetical protein